MTYASIIIRDIMAKGIFEVRLNDNLKEIIKVISENDISSVIVSDDNGTYWGVITELDILKHLGENLDNLTAEDIATTKLITISPKATIEKAIEVMTKNKIHHLYVVGELHGDKVVGVVSAGDIIKAINNEINKSN